MPRVVCGVRRLQEMSSIYTYQGEETCAADGMCQVKCPVKINTGDLIKSIRKEQLGQDSRASKTAMVRTLHPHSPMLCFRLCSEHFGHFHHAKCLLLYCCTSDHQACCANCMIPECIVGQDPVCIVLCKVHSQILIAIGRGLLGNSGI